MADATAVIADIVSGQYDEGDQLIALREALDTRANAEDIDLAWSVRFGELTIDKTNRNGNGATIGMAMALNKLNSRSLRHVDPMGSDEDRLAIVLAFLMDRDDCTMEVAAKSISEQTFDAITVREYVERDLPKDPSTPDTP